VLAQKASSEGATAAAEQWEAGPKQKY